MANRTDMSTDLKRVHNFSAGPARLPLPVLEKAQAELPDYHGKGASIMEMSHRSPEYTEINNQARQRVKELLGIGNDYTVLFLQGGASTQFMMAPYNFLGEGKTADYLNTGSWTKKSIKEANLFGNINLPFDSSADNFTHVPTDQKLNYSSDAEYVYFCSNNTIFGTQFPKEPETRGIPLICDASSDFLSRPIDVDKYGVIFAGAQKNVGPAGVTVVILKNEFMEKARTESIPSMMSYKTHADKLFNTPPVFAVYMVNLVLEWMEEQGGLSYFKRFNKEKAQKLYNEIDKDDFYKGTAQKASRSIMNVTFRLPNEELETKFREEAAEHDIVAIKGHRSVGGIRASIYNACPMESVDALVDFMQKFRNQNS